MLEALSQRIRHRTEPLTASPDQPRKKRKRGDDDDADNDASARLSNTVDGIDYAMRIQDVVDLLRGRSFNAMMDMLTHVAKGKPFRSVYREEAHAIGHRQVFAEIRSEASTRVQESARVAFQNADADARAPPVVQEPVPEVVPVVVPQQEQNSHADTMEIVPPEPQPMHSSMDLIFDARESPSEEQMDNEVEVEEDEDEDSDEEMDASLTGISQSINLDAAPHVPPSNGSQIPNSASLSQDSYSVDSIPNPWLPMLKAARDAPVVGARPAAASVPTPVTNLGLVRDLLFRLVSTEAFRDIVSRELYKFDAKSNSVASEWARTTTTDPIRVLSTEEVVAHHNNVVGASDAKRRRNDAGEVIATPPKTNALVMLQNCLACVTTFRDVLEDLFIAHNHHAEPPMLPIDKTEQLWFVTLTKLCADAEYVLNDAKWDEKEFTAAWGSENSKQSWWSLVTKWFPKRGAAIDADQDGAMHEAEAIITSDACGWGPKILAALQMTAFHFARVTIPNLVGEHIIMDAVSQNPFRDVPDPYDRADADVKSYVEGDSIPGALTHFREEAKRLRAILPTRALPASPAAFYEEVLAHGRSAQSRRARSQMVAQDSAVAATCPTYRFLYPQSPPSKVKTQVNAITLLDMTVLGRELVAPGDERLTRADQLSDPRLLFFRIMSTLSAVGFAQTVMEFRRIIHEIGDYNKEQAKNTKTRLPTVVNSDDDDMGLISESLFLRRGRRQLASNDLIVRVGWAFDQWESTLFGHDAASRRAVFSSFTAVHRFRKWRRKVYPRSKLQPNDLQAAARGFVDTLEILPEIAKLLTAFDLCATLLLEADRVDAYVTRTNMRQAMRLLDQISKCMTEALPVMFPPPSADDVLIDAHLNIWKATLGIAKSHLEALTSLISASKTNARRLEEERRAAEELAARKKKTEDKKKKKKKAKKKSKKGGNDTDDDDDDEAEPNIDVVIGSGWTGIGSRSRDKESMVFQEKAREFGGIDIGTREPLTKRQLLSLLVIEGMTIVGLRSAGGMVRVDAPVPEILTNPVPGHSEIRLGNVTDPTKKYVELSAGPLFQSGLVTALVNRLARPDLYYYDAVRRMTYIDADGYDVDAQVDSAAWYAAGGYALVAGMKIGVSVSSLLTTFHPLVLFESVVPAGWVAAGVGVAVLTYTAMQYRKMSRPGHDLAHAGPGLRLATIFGRINRFGDYALNASRLCYLLNATFSTASIGYYKRVVQFSAGSPVSVAVNQVGEIVWYVGYLATIWSGTSPDQIRLSYWHQLALLAISAMAALKTFDAVLKRASGGSLATMFDPPRDMSEPEGWHAQIFAILAMLPPALHSRLP